MANPVLVSGVNIRANPLLDEEFMRKLHHDRLRNTYARIIALDNEELPLENIEGVITQGTVNVDGTSAVRRTVSLSMVCKEFNIHEFYWGLKTKVEIWAGVENNVDKRYDDIIWFKQGTFVLSSFNTSESLGSYTVSLQGKDKMVLLNGEMGGTITSLTWDFGVVNVIASGGYTYKEKLLLKDIIRDAVHTFAVMPFHKIWVNDLEDMGLELMEYRGSEPMYILINKLTNRSTMTLDGDTEFFRNATGNTKIKIKNIPDTGYNPLFDLEQLGATQDNLYIIYDSQRTPFTVARVTYGMTAGYRLTDLTYAGDLILNVGENITSLLDKIVNMLGEYEYFFDLDGNFIFQRKKIYLRTAWNGIETNANKEMWAEPSKYHTDITYSFEDAELITQYSNSPKYNEIRNDFSIWGTRKGVTGKELPVHMRFAIDHKPVDYVTCEGIKYTTKSLEENTLFEERMSQMTISEEDQSRIAAANISAAPAQHEYWELVDLMENRTNPGGLPDEWWDINDWAKVWILANNGDESAVPPDTMRHYSEQPYPALDFRVYFNDPHHYASSSNKWHMVVIDSDNNIVEPQHNSGCGHPYTWWLEKMAQTGYRCFIYKPIMPDDLAALVTTLVEQAKQEMNSAVVNLYGGLYNKIYPDLDWREIIYQMAEDYNRHHTEEDFFLQVSHNNPYSYPTGMTGYEPYYTDMDGFWRELYNPFYSGHYTVVGMSKAKYQVAINNWWDLVFDGQTNDNIFPYYYRVPKYVQCDPYGDSYHKDMQYYTRSTNAETGLFDYTAVRPTIAQYNANPALYFFEDLDGNNYIQCTVEPWDKATQYYIKTRDTSTNKPKYKAIEVLESTYKATPTNYYYLNDPENDKDTCLVIEPFENSKYWFTYNQTANSTTNMRGMVLNETYRKFSKGTTLTSAKYKEYYEKYKRSNALETSPMKLIRVHYLPCFKAEQIQTYYTYYYIDEHGKEQKLSGSKVDKEDYYNNPTKYWRYEGIYRQCAANESYDPTQTYYIRGERPTTSEYMYTASKQVSQDRFEDDPTRYWVCTNDHVQVKCYKAEMADNLNLGNVLYLTHKLADMNDEFNVDTAITHISNPSANQVRLLTAAEAANATTCKANLNSYILQKLEQNTLTWAVFGEFTTIIHPIEYQESLGFYIKENNKYTSKYWVPAVYQYPETLNFWFDFLDNGGELMKYSSHAIGNRPKAVNDSNVKSIYFRETPTIIYTEGAIPENPSKLGYSYCQIGTNLLDLFSLSGQGKSAKTVLDQYLYQYAQMGEEISFTTMPYYNLEPNKRIFVSCSQSGISGEYIMIRFSVPLGPVATTSITATKAVDALY